jgi:wyosine [tRNA(Phe)-imidazoG37] synthetase (radical SAM superfamily)
MNRYVFGPVPSRRLGFSLGVDIIPRKTCTFDCVYCQVGRTTDKTAIRSSFFDPHEIIDEVVKEVNQNPLIDVVTFSGSGEPTLSQDLGTIIRGIKDRVSTPIAVITNGSLLIRPDVREDLAAADLVVPSLDAVTEEVFLRINRPVRLLKVEEVIEGLKAFRTEYQGQIWLEIMLIQNINDDTQHLELLRKTVTFIGADKIQLNTVTRPPCDRAITGMSSHRLAELKAFFGANCEVICEFKKTGTKCSESGWAETILSIVRRRSLTIEDVIAVTGVSREEADRGLQELVNDKLIMDRSVDGVLYYQAAE